MLSTLLLPLSWFIQLLATLRRWRWRAGRATSARQRVGVPVIVVGNITVGGSGKTPLVLWLVERLKQRGYAPGIVSRGYGGTQRPEARLVQPDESSACAEYGDEPVLLALRGQVPVVVCPDRLSAAMKAKQAGCDVVVSDDGMQHYAMPRNLEVAVVDGERLYGNLRTLPSGPLREPVSRLKSVDFIVTHGGQSQTAQHHYRMELTGDRLHALTGNETRSLSDWHGQQVHAVAGIGYPARFFQALQRAGLKPIEHAFADHHAYCADDFKGLDGLPIIMTEKDAVKCRLMNLNNAWYLPVSAVLTPDLCEPLCHRLENPDG